MGLADVKARIKSQLEAVAGIGQVHASTRYIQDEAVAMDQLVAGGVLNAWFISRESMALKDETVNQSPTELKDVIVIHGFYAVKDNVSEPLFDALLDAVVTKLNTDRRPLGGGGTLLNATVKATSAPQVRAIDYRMFGPEQALCHHAEIVMPVVMGYLQ